MKFTIDTEFDGYGGELLSLALVPWDNELGSLYLRVPQDHKWALSHLSPWVAENVWPFMDSHAATWAYERELGEWPGLIAYYLSGFAEHGGGVPYIIADWPDDIAYFCKAIVTGPGTMAAIPRLQFDMARVDPYEAGSAPPGAVRHNAWWDAVALRDHLKLHTKGE